MIKRENNENFKNLINPKKEEGKNSKKIPEEIKVEIDLEKD